MLSICVPLVFRDAENPDPLTSRSSGGGGEVAVGTVSARIASGPAQLRESSHPGNGQGDGTAWRRAVEMRDFQPVAFSSLIPPLISPALTSRTETHATLSSHSLSENRNPGLRAESQGRIHEKCPACFESLATFLRAVAYHSATYRCI